MWKDIGDDRLDNLLFVDDQATTTEDTDDIHYIRRKLDDEYKKWHLTINERKTEYMCLVEMCEISGSKQGLISIKGTKTY